MSDDSGKTKKLSLSSGKLTLGAIDPSKLRAGPTVGAGRKTVQVEVRRKRAPAAPSRTQTPAAVEAPAAHLAVSGAAGLVGVGARHSTAQSLGAAYSSAQTQ